MSVGFLARAGWWVASTLIGEKLAGGFFSWLRGEPAADTAKDSGSDPIATAERIGKSALWLGAGAVVVGAVALKAWRLLSPKKRS